MRPLVITTLLFNDFELLDVFGPLEMFGLAKHLNDRYRLQFISQDGQAVKSSAGPVSHVELSFATPLETDILLVPEGLGTRSQVDNPELIKWLEQAGKKAKWLVSVCTGTALLARAGLLDGQRATANKMAYQWVCEQGKHTEWVSKARWVQSNQVWTSSGVSAGTDMALAILTAIEGEAFAKKVANYAEYQWNPNPNHDPFAELYGLN